MHRNIANYFQRRKKSIFKLKDIPNLKDIIFLMSPFLRLHISTFKVPMSRCRLTLEQTYSTRTILSSSVEQGHWCQLSNSSDGI